MTCHCEQCSDTPKPTYTEEFRHKAYMNFILSHDDDWIRNYLASAMKNLGKAGHDKLRSDVTNAWKDRQERKKVINLNDRRNKAKN